MAQQFSNQEQSVINHMTSYNFLDKKMTDDNTKRIMFGVRAMVHVFTTITMKVITVPAIESCEYNDYSRNYLISS